MNIELIQILTTYLPVIISLASIEILLSIDNALINASLAEDLPESKQKSAIRIGILGGAGLRLVALFFATYLIQNKWILILGGLYLIYVAFSHLFRFKDEGNKTVKKKSQYKFVVAQIIFADIIFSIDNVISAVGISHTYSVIVTGVLIGVISMLFVTNLISGVIHKHPILKKSAYVIIGLIGLILVLESTLDLHISELTKFGFIVAILVSTYIFSYHKNKKVIGNLELIP